MEQEVQEFQTLLKFEKDRHLVGIKFLFSQKEYEEIQVKEASHQMFFCMMVKAAAVGHCMKVRQEHLYCPAAAEVLGFAKPDEDTRSGKTALRRNFYGSEEVARDVSSQIPYLEHTVYGMCIQPLEQWEEEPDVVLMFCIPYTAMRIIQGYTYKYGIAKNICLAGMSGICTELMAGAYWRQDLNISFLCSGTRLAGSWRDEELGIAVPYSMFSKILDGVRDTLNTYEPDEKKEEILERAKERGVSETITMGTNYHGSSIGVARMGVEGYRPKKRRKNYE